MNATIELLIVALCWLAVLGVVAAIIVAVVIGWKSDLTLGQGSLPSWAAHRMAHGLSGCSPASIEHGDDGCGDQRHHEQPRERSDE
jgi:hypothetical protein